MVQLDMNIEENNKLTECEESLKTIKSKLLQNEKMVSLGSLVAGFTHDLSTPVGLGITGMSNFLELTNNIKHLYETQKMTEDDFKTYINKAQKTADLIYKNLEATSELMLSFKKISVDQTSDLIRRFNLHSYFDDVVSSLNSKIKNTKIAITNNIDKEIQLNSYAGAYSQIFTNLIMNSLIHAFEKDSEGTIEIKAQIENTNIILEYKDNGKGISKENLKKIFIPFFTTKIDDGGSGLGANIIYDLVTNRLSGEIDVYSKENEGTTFKLAIPLDVK